MNKFVELVKNFWFIGSEELFNFDEIIRSFFGENTKLLSLMTVC